MDSSAESLEVRPFARLFKALGDETRMRIVALLSHGELCVCHIEAALGLPQPTVSRQLAVLRNAGVVEHRRKGTWVSYHLAEQGDADCEHQLCELVTAFTRSKTLGRDVRRLLRARGPNSCE